MKVFHHSILYIFNSLRNMVWPIVIGNHLQITPSLYDILRDRLNYSKNEIETKGSSHYIIEESFESIYKDLPRTFPYLSYFGISQPLYYELKEILEIFVCYRPDLGYVQGMSYIAGLLCIYCLNDNYMAFQCFCNLVLNKHLFGFLRLEAKILDYYWTAFSIAFRVF